MKDIEALASFAVELADLSRNIIRAQPIWEVVHEIKADGSPVTPVDREVERRLRVHIDARYPRYGVVGEEFPDRDPRAERVWVIDPIDGTKQYTAGIPVYGTLIALAEAGRFVLGVMDYPATGDRWVGGAGYPTLWNGTPVSVGRCADLGRASVASGDPNRGSLEEQRAFMRLAHAAAFGVWGAASYGFAQVASGRLDVAFDTGLAPYDFAAAAAVVEGAGGSATDWQGRPLTLASGGRALFVGHPDLLGPALELLEPNGSESIELV